MAIRTINSPGVEIVERDLSQYTNGPVGTAVLVTGFAAKGRDYEPILLTSRSAWLQQFGEPTTEAERYFFNACMEVINQGGRLYACKLPYKNEALNKFTAKTYTVDVAELKQLSTVAEYVERYGLDDILAGNFTRFGQITSPTDKDALEVFFQAKDLSEEVNAFADAVDNYTIAIPYAYAEDEWMDQINIESTTQDNWMYTPVKFICEKLRALFDGGSGFWEGVSSHPISIDVSGETKVINSITGLVLSGDGWAFPKGNADACVDYFVKAVGDAFDVDNIDEDRFKEICDPKSGINLQSIVKSFPEFRNSVLYKFYEANAAFFEELNTYDFNQDNEYFNGLKPYFYCDNDRFNLATYWLANKDYETVKEAEKTVADTDVVSIVNKVITLDKFFEKEAPGLSAVFDKPLTMIGDPGEYAKTDLTSSVDLTSTYETAYGWNDTPDADKELTRRLIMKPHDEILNPLDELQVSFKKLFANSEYQDLIEKATAGEYQDSDFAPFAIQYYLDHTNVTNPYDRKTLRDAKNLNIFYDTVADDGILSTKEGNFFETYNNLSSYTPELSSADAVIAGAIQTLTYDKFLDFAKNFVASDKYQEISAYAYSPETSAKTLQDTITALDLDKISSILAYSEIKKADNTVKSYIKIDSDHSNTELVDLETIDGYATGETPVRTNRIVIVDKTRGTLGTAFAKTSSETQKELVGIIPIITTAANALYVQALLETGDSGISKYNAVKTAETLANANVGPYVIADEDAAVPFMSDNAGTYTVSQLVAGSFPSIHFDSDGRMDRQNLKKIGVVVLRAFLDPGEGNKVNYDIVEAYAGELDKNAVDPNTGATTFIDTLVNTQSEYIEFYSNCFNQTATRELYSKADLFVIPPQKAGDLGFYQYMTKKNISLTDSISKALPLIWEKNEDINEKQIDIVCDAGVSNIAQFIKSCYNGKAGEYDPASEVAALFKLRSKEDTKTWRAVLDMYDNFCKNIRKDCMFVADGPRPFCLTGNKKIVRPSKPSNTIDGTILPMLKFITGVNTNYGAGYCDWFQKADEFSGDYFWCPPSIQAMGVYLNTDINFDFWMAPAGLNRGVVSALDVAFNPTQRQSDEIYPKCWNYARSYPNDGIVLEGQRTFQTKPSKLDRVHARRTMLRMERLVYQIAKYFVYETNNTYNRQRFYDAVDGVFKEYKGLGAITDFKILCDETLNTPEVIDRNEFRCKIGLKIPGVMEFILIEFNLLRSGGSWTEML